MLEKEMYKVIKNHLQNLGFQVKAEVLDADITAIKDDVLIIVEMKNLLNIKLLYQGTQRQRLTDYVYLAIPKPNYKVLRSKGFKEKAHIINRLNLGLMFVDMEKETVETYCDPSDSNIRKDRKKKIKLLKEFENRYTSFNSGGVTKTKIITSYREKSLIIAHYLENAPLTIKQLRELTDIKNCSSILYKNYYFWFEKVSRGVYQLNDLGRHDLIQYDYVIKEIFKT